MLTRGDRHCKSPFLSLKDHIDAFDAGSFPWNTFITRTIIMILNTIDKQRRVIYYVAEGETWTETNGKSMMSMGGQVSGEMRE